MGRTSEFFQNFDATPTRILWTDDYETDRGQEELLKILSQADRNSWVMCGSVLKSMKKSTRNAPVGVLKGVGLKNCHSYSIIEVREVILDNGELEYMVFIRNPTGNIFNKEDEVWKGDWSPLSNKWTNKVRKQLGYYTTLADRKKAIKEGREALKKFRQVQKNKNSEEVKQDEETRLEEGIEDLEL